MHLTVLAAVAWAAEPGYIDPAGCRPCHAAIYDSYSKTGMARTFGPAGKAVAVERFDHKASSRWYTVEQRSDGNSKHEPRVRAEPGLH